MAPEPKESDLEDARFLGRLLESRLFWKYGFLIAVLFAVGLYLDARDPTIRESEIEIQAEVQEDGVRDAVLYDEADRVFSRDSLAQGLFYSVITSLIVSLFYDFGTRRDLVLQMRHERSLQRRLTSEDMLGAIDVNRLPESTADKLAGMVAASESMLQAISIKLLGGQGQTFYEAWLKPLVDQEVLYDVVVENKLCQLPNRQDAYAMRFTQAFSAPRMKQRFVIVVTCDNDVYNDLITSDAQVDEMVGTSQEEWATIDDQLKSLELKSWRVLSGRRESQPIDPRAMTSVEISGYLNRDLERDHVRGFSFELHPDADWRYEISYAVHNRLSDPYYYWTAELPMFIDRLSFDYRDLREQFGSVAANCILGNSAGEPRHDIEEGTYEVDVRSLVWPGQGGLLVWRGPPADPDHK